ncbi:keratin, type I cytoskeletal 13-like [Ambystoma mexicanum]|uniref:keratin, type I cytoskeletal 13-like n=1 Tax=Ambystoma mexicanum TaxID=8296 RepID=UPI0037E89A83
MSHFSSSRSFKGSSGSVKYSSAGGGGAGAREGHGSFGGYGSGGMGSGFAGGSGSVRHGGGSSGGYRSAGGFHSAGSFGFGDGYGYAGDIGAGGGYGDSGGFAVGGGYGTGGGFGAGGGFGGGSGGGFWQGGGDGGLLSGGSEKQTMQNLNDRLANYLDKVNALEDANSELEKKIREWYAKQSPTSTTKDIDYSGYYKTIEELKAKILAADIENGTLILAIDNTRLTADDFKLKYENELFFCQAVDADNNGLRRVLDELTVTKSDLEMQIESLTEELVALKKNHEDELKEGSQGQEAGSVNVKMNAAPGVDLLKALNVMREDYEKLSAKYRKEAEDQFQAMSKDLVQQVATDSQATHSVKSDASSLRQSLQSLEIELQSQLSMKASLESTLAETEGRYCMQLNQLQIRISQVEEELGDLRADMENQSSEYQMLLDIKARLEQEISTYRSLIEGQDVKVSGGDSKPGTGTSTTKPGVRYR